MKLESAYVRLIEQYLEHEGLENVQLIQDLTDHFACSIEQKIKKENLDFENAFRQSQNEICPDGPLAIQRDTYYLITIKNQIMLRKIVFIVSYLSVFQIIMAYAFQAAHILQPQVAMYLAMGGYFLFATSALPYLFYRMYQRSVNDLREAS